MFEKSDDRGNGEHTNTETARHIMHDELDMTKVCALMVQRNLTQEQKANFHTLPITSLTSTINPKSYK